MRTLALITMLLAAAVLVGCGGEDRPTSDPTTPTPTQSTGLAAGPGVSIQEAIDSDLDGALLVNGNLLAQGGEVRLCSALAESFPPQCGGASLVVEGLKLEEVDGLITEGEVSWTDRPIQLLGVVEDGALTVSENARA
jgi:hypothetical protein